MRDIVTFLEADGLWEKKQCNTKMVLKIVTSQQYNKHKLKGMRIKIKTNASFN